MPAAAKKKGPPDVAVLLGVPEGEGEMGDMMADEKGGETDELPPGFQTAAEEYENAEAGSVEKAQALYRAIELCNKGGM